MNETELRAFIRQKIKDAFGSQEKFAAAKGIASPFVSMALTGKKRIPKAWLDQFGVEISYRVKE